MSAILEGRYFATLKVEDRSMFFDHFGLIQKEDGSVSISRESRTNDYSFSQLETKQEMDKLVSEFVINYEEILKTIPRIENRYKIELVVSKKVSEIKINTLYSMSFHAPFFEV